VPCAILRRVTESLAAAADKDSGNPNKNRACRLKRMHRWAAVTEMPRTDDRDTSSIVWRLCMSAHVSATPKKSSRKSKDQNAVLSKLQNLIKTGSKDSDGTVTYGNSDPKKPGVEPVDRVLGFEHSVEKTPVNVVSGDKIQDIALQKAGLGTPVGLYDDALIQSDTLNSNMHLSCIVKTGSDILQVRRAVVEGTLKSFGLCVEGSGVKETIETLKGDEVRPLLIDYLRKHCTNTEAGEVIGPVAVLKAVHAMQGAASERNPVGRLEIEELSNLWSTVDKNTTESVKGSVEEKHLLLKKMVAGPDNTVSIEPITTAKEAAMCDAKRLFKPEEATSEKQSYAFGEVVTPDKEKSELGKRVAKVAEMLGTHTKIIEERLTESGVKDNEYGIKLLESSVVSIEDIVRVLEKIVGHEQRFSLKAAASILKGQDPFAKATVEIGNTASGNYANSTAVVLVNALKDLRTISQMKDRELLELYDIDREVEVEQELNRRSKNQPFVILQGESYFPGKEIINIADSMEQLKRARKGYTIPTLVPGTNGKVVRVYRITELNPDDRIVELCPICGDILYKGYCSKCELNFAGVQDDERAYVKLVTSSGNFNAKSHSDRKALHASASKGMVDLRVTWPSIAPTFDDLKLTNNLPRLRMIKNIPAVQVADPFHVSGNRSY